MIDDDEALPQKKAASPRNLEPLSIDELQSYIGDLQAEIARVEAHITAKKAHLSGAEKLFRK